MVKKTISTSLKAASSAPTALRLSPLTLPAWFAWPVRVQSLARLTPAGWIVALVSFEAQCKYFAPRMINMRL